MKAGHPHTSAPIVGDSFGKARSGRLTPGGYERPLYEPEADGDIWPASGPSRPKLTEFGSRLLAEIDLTPTEWMADAQCVEYPDVDFFRTWRKAVDVCGRCDVQSECLQYALEHKITEGVWGGLTATDRKMLDPIIPAGAVVYIAEGPVEGLVKIGTSIELAFRMKTLKLRALVTEPGSYRREAELHRRFAHLRVAGEWFRLEGDLLDYVGRRLDEQMLDEVAA